MFDLNTLQKALNEFSQLRAEIKEMRTDLIEIKENSRTIKKQLEK